MDESFLSRATAVLAMEDVFDGHRDPNSIGLRHDIDAGHALATAVRMAEWEADRGYRSSYYVLHTSPYWKADGFRMHLERIAELGHEIGIHTDALADFFRTGRDPDVVLAEAIDTLRGYGFRVRGVAGHGNSICNRDAEPGEVWFANDEQFVTCRRPDYGKADRVVTRGSVSLRLRPRPLADFGLEYEALWLPNPIPFRVSDSGGRWVNPGWEESVVRWQSERAAFPHVTEPTRDVRQLHLLVHPDWWAEAFVVQAVAA
jgi:hypothetical protein